MKAERQALNRPENQSIPIEALQRAAVNEAPVHDVPPIVHEVLISPGQALDRETEAFFESRFGHDFSQVRVHTDTKAAESARAVNALAYSVGNDVVFSEGQFAPSKIDGQLLLAHELTHVAYQSNAPVLQRAKRETVSEVISQEPEIPEALHHDFGESKVIGDEIERPEVKEWKSVLEKQGYEVYTKTNFYRAKWITLAFPNKKRRPDLIAVHRKLKKVLVGDVTAGEWSSADPREGDVRKIPNDSGIEPKPVHLEKTIDDARQVVRNLPNDPKEGDFRNYEVLAQDRYWKSEHKYSRQIVVKSVKQPRATPKAATGGLAKAPPAAKAEPTKAPDASNAPPPTPIIPAEKECKSKEHTVNKTSSETSDQSTSRSTAKGKTEQPTTEVKLASPANPEQQPISTTEPLVKGSLGASSGFWQKAKTAARTAASGTSGLVLAMAAQSYLFDSAQQAELDKAHKYYREIVQPKVVSFNAQGFWVAVIAVIEVPKYFDTGALITSYHEIRDLKGFVTLFCQTGTTKEEALQAYPSIGPAPADEKHSSEMARPPQGRNWAYALWLISPPFVTQEEMAEAPAIEQQGTAK